MSMQENLVATENKAIATRLWTLAYPTMIAMAMQSFYDIVDIAWIGQYSAEAVSGVTIFTVLYGLFAVLNEVAGSSSVSMISQSYGRGDHAHTQRIAEQTISFKVVLAILSGLLLFVLLEPLLSLYTQNEAVIKYALDYGWLRIFFLPLAFSSYSVNTIFRCTDDSKTPMKIMIFSGFLNLILDPIFIFDVVPDIGAIKMPFEIRGLGMGAFGASLATVISITASFLIGFAILLSGKKGKTISLRGLLRLDKNIDLDLLRIGLPIGFNLFIRQLFMALLIKFVSSYGDIATALSGVGGKLSAFALVPLFGFGMSGSALVGHNLGRNDVEEAKRTAIIGACICCGIVIVITLFIIAFPRLVLSFFFTDPATIEQGVSMLRILGLSFIPLSFALGLQVVFSGSGHNRPLLYSTIGSSWLVQLPYLLIVVYLLKLPLEAVWFSYILAEIAHLGIIIYHYKKGVWETKRV
ncbi:MAG: MATE family efflux transporter [Treponemataceae bacterium]